MTTHFSILAWEISWTEEPGGLQSMGSQKNGTQLYNGTEIGDVFNALGFGCVII